MVSPSKDMGVDYMVKVDSQPWLRSAPTGVTHSSRTFFSDVATCNTTCLTPDPAGPTTTSGMDAHLGAYVSASLRWTSSPTSSDNDFVFVTTFKAFTNLPILVFEQAYPNGAQGTRPLNGGSNHHLGSFFPSWSRSSPDTVKSLQTFAGNGQSGSARGPWQTVDYGGGIQGGVPLVLYQPTAKDGRTLAPRAVVMSPLGNYMVSEWLIEGVMQCRHVAFIHLSDTPPS